jgi:hypothetical protein
VSFFACFGSIAQDGTARREASSAASAQHRHCRRNPYFMAKEGLVSNLRAVPKTSSTTHSLLPPPHSLSKWGLPLQTMTRPQ